MTREHGSPMCRDQRRHPPLGSDARAQQRSGAVNGDDGIVVAVKPAKAQDAAKVPGNSVTYCDKNGGGTPSGPAPVPNDGRLYFVDDATNSLNLLH